MRFINAAIAVATLFPVTTFAAELTAKQVPFQLQSIPQGAQRVSMLTIELQASCDADVTIEQISLRHAGLGSASDLPRVYVIENGRRLSNAQSFSGRNRTATLRPRGVMIEACASRTLTIAADFSADAAPGGEHRIVLAGMTTDVGPATIVTTNPAPPVRATPGTTGTITVDYLPLHSTVRYGNNRTVARIRLSADGEADQYVREIILTNDGSAKNTDLINLEIMDGQRVLAVRDALDEDRVHFILEEPLLLGRNASKLLTIRADVRASVKRTIRLTVDEPSDIIAEPKQRGRQ